MSVEHIARIVIDPQDEDVDTQQKLNTFIEFCLRTWPIANKSEFSVETSSPLEEGAMYALVLNDGETFTDLRGCTIQRLNDEGELDASDDAVVFTFPLEEE